MLNPWRHQATLEAERRRNRESTYTQPLGLDAGDDSDLKALQAFLKEFYPTFYQRPAQAARQKRLDDHPEVAFFHFSLVPTVVSEEEFWQRYEYRCDEARILQEWERHPTRGRQVMGKAMSSWLDSKVESVKNLVVETTTNSTATSSTETNSKEESKAGSSKQPLEQVNNSFATIGKKSWFQSFVTATTTVENEDSKNLPSQQPLKESKKHTSNEDVVKGDPGSFVMDDKERKEKFQFAYVPPHKRSKEAPKQQAYVPPHKRGRAGGGSGKAPASLKARVEGKNNNKPSTKATVSEKQESSKSIVDSKTRSLASSEASTPSEKVGSLTSANNLLPQKNALYLLAVILAAMLVVLFLPRVFGIELSICASSTLELDQSWWRHPTQSMLCRSGRNSSLEPVSFGKKQSQKKNYNKPKKDSKRNRDAKLEEATVAASIFSANNNNNPNVPMMNAAEDSGGLVQSLLSSWMQNTDLSQFTLQNTDLAQVENHWNNNAMQVPPKKGGLVGFFQRRFGKNRQSEALATPGHPQMVVHQHIHHVVHHVVHEVRQS